MAVVDDLIQLSVNTLGQGSIQEQTGLSITEIEKLSDTILRYVKEMAERPERLVPSVADFGPDKSPTELDEKYSSLILFSVLTSIMTLCRFQKVKKNFEKVATSLTEAVTPDNMNTDGKRKARRAQIDSATVHTILSDEQPKAQINKYRVFNYWHIRQKLPTLPEDTAIGLAMNQQAIYDILKALEDLPGDRITYDIESRLFKTQESGQKIEAKTIGLASSFCVNLLQDWLNRLEVSIAVNDSDVEVGRA